MVKHGVPERFIAIVKSFDEGILAIVLDEGESSETFQVTNGVKQGCAICDLQYGFLSHAENCISWRHTPWPSAIVLIASCLI